MARARGRAAAKNGRPVDEEKVLERTSILIDKRLWREFKRACFDKELRYYVGLDMAIGAWLSRHRSTGDRAE